MTISPLREVVILSSSLLSGVIMGVICDMLRRIKRLFGFNSLLVDIGDVIVFVILSGCAYCSVYIINDGKVRWYEIFGIFSGFFMYMSALSPYVIKMLIFFEKVLGSVLLTIRKILSPLIKIPLRLIAAMKKRISAVNRKRLSLKFKKIFDFSKIKYIFRKI